MKKRNFIKGATLVLSLAFLASCGGNDTPVGPDTDATGVIKEATTIEVWTTLGSDKKQTFEDFVTAFKKVEPNVEVKTTYISGSYSDLKSAVVKGFTSNNYPDLVQAYPDHVAEYINYSKAVNLEDYMYNSEYGWSKKDLNDIIPDYIQEGQEYAVDGTYSLPFSKSTEQMFYNEDKLIGLNLSAYDSSINNGRALDHNYINNLTWDELFDHLCPAIVAHDADPANANNKLIKTEGNDYSAVFGYDSDSNLFITLAKQYGYDYTSYDKSAGKASVEFNNDGMKSLMKKFNDAASKGYIISTGSAGNNYTSNYFTNDGILFSVGSTAGVTYQFSTTNPMNVGIAKIPQADTKNAYTINQGPSITMLDHSDENRKLASWLFYKFIENEDNSLTWTLNTGYNATRYSNFESEDYKEAADYESKEEKTVERLMAKSKAGLSDVGTLFVSPAFKGSSTIRDQVGGIVTKALSPKAYDISDLDKWFSDAEATSKLAL